MSQKKKTNFRDEPFERSVGGQQDADEGLKGEEMRRGTKRRVLTPFMAKERRGRAFVSASAASSSSGRASGPQNGPHSGSLFEAEGKAKEGGDNSRNSSLRQGMGFRKEKSSPRASLFIPKKGGKSGSHPAFHLDSSARGEATLRDEGEPIGTETSFASSIISSISGDVVGNEEQEDEEAVEGEDELSSFAFNNWSDGTLESD